MLCAYLFLVSFGEALPYRVLFEIADLIAVGIQVLLARRLHLRPQVVRQTYAKWGNRIGIGKERPVDLDRFRLRFHFDRERQRFGMGKKPLQDLPAWEPEIGLLLDCLPFREL